ncbi:YybH family protein [Acidobacteriota bacterium]
MNKRLNLILTLTAAFILAPLCMNALNLSGSFDFFGRGQKRQNLPVEFDTDEVLKEWVEMWNTYDLDRVKELFLNEERLTYFSSEREGTIRGLEAVLKHHEGFGFIPGGKSTENRLWVEGIQTDLFGITAIVTAVWYFKKPDAETQRGPMTVVYALTQEGWRIAHMNFSEYRNEVVSPAAIPLI